MSKYKVMLKNRELIRELIIEADEWSAEPHDGFIRLYNITDSIEHTVALFNYDSVVGIMDYDLDEVKNG